MRWTIQSWCLLPSKVFQKFVGRTQLSFLVKNDSCVPTYMLSTTPFTIEGLPENLESGNWTTSSIIMGVSHLEQHRSYIPFDWCFDAGSRCVISVDIGLLVGAALKSAAIIPAATMSPDTPYSAANHLISIKIGLQRWISIPRMVRWQKVKLQIQDRGWRCFENRFRLYIMSAPGILSE